jgi:predicted PhzF superfamily epimerase YddE/YHI9
VTGANESTGSPISVDVVRVFTTEHGNHGNELGVVEDIASAGREQAIAARLGFSETVFLEPVQNGVVSVQIFTPGRELPFAGHPSVGTAWWEKHQGRIVTTLAEKAGDVAVDYEGDLTWITGRAEWAPNFEWTELASPAEVDALQPTDFAAGEHYLYSWIDETVGTIRSRMFAPGLGVAEDQATGAAAVALTARLGRDLDITQGIGCRLFTRQRPGGYVSVGGYTVFDRTIALS